MGDPPDTAPPRILQAWQARQRSTAQPAMRTAPPVDHGPRPRYVQAALNGEIRAIQEAPEGTRNGQLNTSSLKLGRLVGAGLLDEDVATDALRAAARTAGLGPREIALTIRSGMRAGIGDPRDPGERQRGDGRPLRELPGAAAGTGGDSTGPGGGATPGSGPTVSAADYVQPAGAYLRSLPDKPEPVWGSGDQVLWAQGEALMIAGGPGLGKTTIAGQLVRARLGWQHAVLDLPVMPGDRRVLYLMMDRPQQIARRLLQQFTPGEIDSLDDRMRLGVGPPPRDLARFPDLLPELCSVAGADTVIVDSLKDAALGLTDDETGAGWNRARQLTVAAGVQVLELHHLVKRGANGKDPETLADVYGSAWLTAGVGSCLVLLGEAGSPLVKARHLKPVMEPFGPAELAHDHERGITTVHQHMDLLASLAFQTVLTATSAARLLYDVDRPDRSERERARRKLDALVAQGKAVKRAGAEGRIEATYHPLTARSLTELREQRAAEDLTLELED